MIKAVFFDVDNTLYDFERVRRYGLLMALQHLYERLPNTRGRITLELLMKLREQVAVEMPDADSRLIEVRTESFRRALAICGHKDDLAPDLARIYYETRFCCATPYSGTLEVLPRLHGRYVLGIISNGDTQLGEIGIKNCFDHIIMADEVGFAKPDRRIFEIAMDRVPCRPDEFIYVGDSPELDVVGAKNAGARVVWFNPSGQTYPAGLAPPDFEISDLGELVGVIERICCEKFVVPPSGGLI
ncbi:HAD family hydrolase [Candidatus Sumerlaeota bacterium]|nr:HAD family hydrolase [Candidatus Sumerlaeota bacterium]